MRVNFFLNDLGCERELVITEFQLVISIDEATSKHLRDGDVISLVRAEKPSETLSPESLDIFRAKHVQEKLVAKISISKISEKCGLTLGGFRCLKNYISDALEVNHRCFKRRLTGINEISLVPLKFDNENLDELYLKSCLMGKRLLNGQIISYNCLGEMVFYRVEFVSSDDYPPSNSEYIVVSRNTNLRLRKSNILEKLITLETLKIFEDNVGPSLPNSKQVIEGIDSILRLGPSKNPSLLGFIFQGPSGCGKTHIVTSIVELFELPCLYLNGTLFDRKTLEKTLISLKCIKGPVFLVLEDIEKADAKMLIRELLDHISEVLPFPVVVLATSCGEVAMPEIETIPICLQVVKISSLSQVDRIKILERFSRETKLEGSPVLEKLAKNSQGHSIADLLSKFSDILMLENPEGDELAQILSQSIPSNILEFQYRFPNVSFSDFISFELETDFLKAAIKSWESGESSRGIIIEGPSGSGKTKASMALANESGFNKIYLDGSSLRSKFVGDSEKKLARVFDKARQSSPCLIIIENIDIVLGNRNNVGSKSGRRLINQFLTEIDGIFSSSSNQSNSAENQVFICATCERISDVDEALVRPGRIDKHLKLSFPDSHRRRCILKTLMNESNIINEALLDEFVTHTKGMSFPEICSKINLAMLEIGKR